MPKTINLLEEWYKEAWVLSSPFQLQLKMDRRKVDFIYQTLSAFFSEKFFTIQKGSDRSVEKTSWLYSLLANHHHGGCYHALYDICQLINYSTCLPTSLRQEMVQLKRNPENLRTFFFELFIYRMLDTHNITHVKKPTVGRQVLEGTCELEGILFLFECRKNFLPNLSELDVKRRLMQDLHHLGQAQKHGRGMICTIELSRPVRPLQLDRFRQKLRRYFDGLDENSETMTIDYNDRDEHGIFYARNYDEASLIETKAGKQYDLLFYVTPPKVVIPDQPNLYQVHIQCNFSLDRSAIYKKFERILKGKVEQHRKSVYQNKIFFFDSEFLPELHMNLFQNESMYDPNEISRVCQRIGFKDILCMVRRDYQEDGIRVMADVFGPDHFRPVKEQLFQLLQNPFPTT